MTDRDSHSSSDSENHDANTRPNRWKGPPTSWQTLTEPERSLAASLDTIRNADLSVHLFNAHALKRRARELEDPERRRKSVNDFPGIPEEDQAFRPAKGWTAWPLPPDDVPRNGEEIGLPKQFEEYTFKAEEDGAPSRELEDVLIGVTLKYAKERFESRKKVEEGNPDDTWKGKEKDIESDSTGSEYHNSLNEDEPIINEASKSLQPTIHMKSVVSAEDERSRDLLRPSVRHTLSKLDELLMALHHARKTCYRYSHSEAGTTDDESVADTAFSEQAPESPSKRPQGRPRKFADLPTRTKPAIVPSITHEPDHGDPLRPKITHRGRPKKVYERLEGETEQEYAVRVARLQKKPLPAFAPPAELLTTKSPSPRRGRERSRSVPAKRATSKELRDARRRRLDLRDWSEVVGVAALVGFEPDVLERAARRCANLFGEGMVMRRIAEIPFAEREGKDELVRYEPELIPDLDEHMLELSSSDDESGSDSASEPDILPGVRTKSNPSRQAVFCPIQTCPRRVQGFRDMAAVKRHLEKGHKIQKEEVEDYILPSDEEMDGAVHIDGFLKPLKAVRAPRGRYKKQAKKRKASESEDEDDDAEAGAGKWGQESRQHEDEDGLESGTGGSSP
ncbi:hypothetical protein ONS95_013688 [Cadophora gregata]|uniref:uncharacterized protein n=1 Tax=Cadophora gregata TaxID=51156 RepID=UPI0026DD61A7|nr:uncharacterized protein ONS95_013688 [Cadophora gregata]KAK0113430.1 hypothetical protein ONS96_014296 [Cadophora gregata f. sp. sojae]KAK0114188.1 hypothetical protein ONS95_013688 [Cadophora gregata]